MSNIISRWVKSFRAGRNSAAAPASDVDRRMVYRLMRRRWPSRKQLKHIGRYLTAPEKRSVILAVLVLLFGLGASAFIFYREHQVTLPARGGGYVEAAVGEPRFVNPILASGNDTDTDLASLIFSGLLRLDREGHLVPDLASEYSVSEDGKTYVFKLRDKVLWHDGTALSARDVVATIDYIKDPTWNSPLLAQFKNVKAEASDNLTVIFTLTEAYSPFLSSLTLGILPEHRWGNIQPESASRSELNLKPVGTGPFRFKSLAKNRRGAIGNYTLVRNENYYGDKPYLDTITFEFYPTYSEAAAAVSDKRTDGVSYLPPEMRAKTLKSRAVRIYQMRLPEAVAVFLNPNRNPSLRAKEVRQALNLAIDRDIILREAAPPGSLPVFGPITPGLTGFHPMVKKYEIDRNAAAQLLDTAGWKTDETDGLRKKEVKNAAGETEKQPLSLTLTVPDSQDMVEAAQQLERDWRAIGVKVELSIISTGKVRRDVIRPRDYDALLYGQIIGPEPDLYPFWHSSQISTPGLNLTGFSNRRADELLEKTRVAISADERATNYRELQDIIAEDSSAFYLYSPSYPYAVGRRVKGIETGPIFSPAGRFADVTSWYVNTMSEWRR